MNTEPNDDCIIALQTVLDNYAIADNENNIQNTTAAPAALETSIGQSEPAQTCNDELVSQIIKPSSKEGRERNKSAAACIDAILADANFSLETDSSFDSDTAMSVCSESGGGGMEEEEEDIERDDGEQRYLQVDNDKDVIVLDEVQDKEVYCDQAMFVVMNLYWSCYS